MFDLSRLGVKLLKLGAKLLHELGAEVEPSLDRSRFRGPRQVSAESGLEVGHIGLKIIQPNAQLTACACDFLRQELGSL